VLVPQLPTEITDGIVPLIFHRELEKNYGLVPQLPTKITDGIVPSVFHRELEKNYRLVPQLPTESPTAITDGIGGLSEITRPKVHACQRRAITDGIVGRR